MWAIVLISCGSPDDAVVIEAQEAYVGDESDFRELFPRALCRELRDCASGVPGTFDEAECVATFSASVQASSCVSLPQADPCLLGVLLPTAPGYEPCQEYFNYPSSVCTLAVYNQADGQCE
jgi:hypothetical protein